jgi:hypothetical protein
MPATTFQNPGFQPRQHTIPAVDPSHADGSPFQRLGYIVLLVFLFLIFSRIFDVKFSGLHITGVSSRVVFAMMLLSLGFVTALRSSVGKALLGFTIWFGLSVPFSLWRRGSLEIFRESWLLFSFAAFLATAGLIGSYAECRKAIHTVAWALFTLTVIANVFGSMLPVFGAFAAALFRTAQVEIDRVKSTPAPIEGPALMFRPYALHHPAQAGRVVA